MNIFCQVVNRSNVNTLSYKSSLLHLVQMLNSGGGIWKDMKPEIGGPTAWNVDIFVQVLKELVRIRVRR